MNILRKLGLLKRSDVDELIKATEGVINAADGVIEEAKDNEKRFDTAVEMLTDVNLNAKILKGYCKERDCFDCEFDEGYCALANVPPCWWNV